MNLGKISFLVLAFVSLLPCSAKAATLYMDPVSLTSGPEDVFEVKVKIGTGLGECINAANISLTFPSEALEVKDFNSGESILSLWIEKPSAADMEKINQEGRIVFSGGLPGGYCGKVSGDPGDSNLLGSVIFTPKKPILFHKAGVNFDKDTALYLNDGQGTAAKLEAQGMNIDIDEGQKVKKDDWNTKIVEDKVSPEPFVIEISRDDKVADGRYFIVFFAADKQTGIDHYEVLEAKAKDIIKPSERRGLAGLVGKLFPSPSNTAAYERASSPYILKDQSLKSVIKVKAIDRAGNERVVEYQNEALEELSRGQSGPGVWLWASLVAGIFLLLSLCWIVISKFKR